MPLNGRIDADFTRARAIHAALRFALEKKLFSKEAQLRRAAESLLKEVENSDSVYGRQIAMLGALKKGASIAELRKKLGASRRTVFRYLNSLEEAGFQIGLENSRYRLLADRASDAG